MVRCEDAEQQVGGVMRALPLVARFMTTRDCFGSLMLEIDPRRGALLYRTRPPEEEKESAEYSLLSNT